MRAGRRFGRVVEGTALALAFACAGAPAFALDGLRRIPIASVEAATGDSSRNVSDAKAAPETVPAMPVLDKNVLSVLVDRAKVIRLPERTQTVIIGNPAVADISIQKSGVVVLTGKSYGVTNFLALDSSGVQIAESMISVSAPSDATLMVQRGMDRQTYSCTPACQPSIALGDAGGFFSETKGQADQHGTGAAAR